MSLIYTFDLDTGKFKSFERIPEIGFESLLHPKTRNGYKIRSYSLFDQIEFNQLSNQYPFHDLYNGSKIDVFTLHYHNHQECRFILKGEVKFYIPNYEENTLTIIVANEGTLITLDPKVPHFFSADNDFIALRFFQTEDKHQVNELQLTDQMKTIAINFNENLFNFGDF